MSPVRYRAPRTADGRVVHRLVRASGGLEVNTGYAYVLLCDHFGSTAVIAETAEGNPLGFVAAYPTPSRPETIFVWQVAVVPEARGRGIAGAMLESLLARPACAAVRFLEATVTPTNAASRRLFESLAERRGVPLSWSAGYPPTLFDEAHEREDLIRVGPLRAPTRDP